MANFAVISGNSEVTTAITTAVPSQTGNGGKYLTTNGSSTSWGSVTTDPTPTTLMLGGM